MKPSTESIPDSQQTVTHDQLYRIDLKYNGAPFQGWQSQPDGSGVQDHLEKALATILRHKLRVTGASRTDTGVHAEHQVASFRTPVAFEEFKWIRSLQGLLPDSVGVSRLQPVEDSFHPIYSAQAKTYLYRLWRGPTRHPLLAPYCWEMGAGVDASLLRDEAQVLCGTHDFTSFCAVDSSAKTRVRTIREIHVVESGPLIEVWICGEGFLKQMVRIIMGSLVAVASGKLPPGSVASMLQALDRKVAGITAPGQGLCLARIFYETPLSAALLREQVSGGAGFFTQ